MSTAPEPQPAVQDPSKFDPKHYKVELSLNPITHFSPAHSAMASRAHCAASAAPDPGCPAL